MTTEWIAKAADFDFYQELTAHMDTVLRISLNRLHVEEEPLMNLIQATTSMRSKFRDTGLGSVDVVTVLCDVLLDGFRLKTKMQPLTVKAVIGVTKVNLYSITVADLGTVFDIS